MDSPRGWQGLVIAGFIIVGPLGASAFAADSAASYADGATRKLGRGIVNIVSCPGELLRMPTLVGRKDGHLAAMSVGVVQGAWHGLMRGLAGVYEVVTFYAEIPKNFEPIVQPEFVFAQGNWAE